MRLKCVLPLALAALSSGSLALNVRVLVASGASVTVRLAAGPEGASVPGSALNTDWIIGAAGGKLMLGGLDTGSPVLSLPPSPGSAVDIAGRRYRGGLTLRAVNSQVQAINVVDIEDYLRGVVPAEMPPLWPQAAVRAQAIIARTYAAARIDPAAPYDVCATTQCQVYEGERREHPSADAAIQATRAQVVVSAGKLADTYFSSDSGGYTASSLEAWGRDVPYLRAQPDPASPGAQKPWVMSVPLGKVQEVAGRYGANLGRLSTVALSGASRSGRVTAITLSGVLGVKVLSGASAGGFVRSLGARSSRVALGMSGPNLTLTGTGSGHGVGLSQWGARRLAEQGQSELALLSFYYPGASISLVGERPGGLRLNSGASLRSGAVVLVDTLPLTVAAQNRLRTSEAEVCSVSGAAGLNSVAGLNAVSVLDRSAWATHADDLHTLLPPLDAAL
jgi:stage II sporulation protein D